MTSANSCRNRLHGMSAWMKKNTLPCHICILKTMSLAFFSLHWRYREWKTNGKEDLFFGTLVWRFLKIRNLAHLPNLCMDMGSTNFMEKKHGHAKCGCKLKTLSCLCSHFSLFIEEDKQTRATTACHIFQSLCDATLQIELHSRFLHTTFTIFGGHRKLDLLPYIFPWYVSLYWKWEEGIISGGNA